MKYASIAFRNLSRQKKRSFFIAGGVAFGVFLMITVNAFSAGSVRILKENVANMVGGHVFVTVERKVEDGVHEYIDDDSEFFKITRSLGTADSAVKRSIETSGTLIHAGNTAMLGNIIGLDWDDVTVGELQKQLGISAEGLVAIRSDPRAMVISKKTANNLKISVGDDVVMRMQTITGQQNVGDFVVRYITEDDGDIMSFVGFGHQKTIATLLNMPSPTAYTTFQVQLASIDDAPAYAELFKAKAAEFYPIKSTKSQSFSFSSRVRKINPESQDWAGIRLNVTTVNEMLAPLNTAVDGLFVITMIVFIVIMGIVVIGILNTFRVILMERTVEIGTMRALGMQKPNVRSLILYEAFFLSLMGFLAGFVLSVIIQLVTSIFDLGTQSAFSMFLLNGHLNFRIEFWTSFATLAVVSIFTVLAALFPAGKAAKLEPAHALRTAN